MEHLLLALVLVVMGVPLLIFGWAVGKRRFDLAFGDLTVNTTEAPAWDLAHRSAGRGFFQLGLVLTVMGPAVAVTGMPIGGWLTGLALTVLTIGVVMVTARSFSTVASHQLKR